MFREQFAGFLYAVDNAGGEFRFAKITAHGVRQFPPEDIPALGMNRFIPDHGKLVGSGSNEDQYTIPFRGLVHAQAQKFRLRGGHGVGHVPGTDADPDFTGRLVLGIPNGCDDGVVLQVFGEGIGVHKNRLPAPSRAAAATAAAAAREATATASTTTPAAAAAPRTATGPAAAPILGAAATPRTPEAKDEEENH